MQKLPDFRIFKKSLILFPEDPFDKPKHRVDPSQCWKNEFRSWVIHILFSRSMLKFFLVFVLLQQFLLHSVLVVVGLERLLENIAFL